MSEHKILKEKFPVKEFEDRYEVRSNGIIYSHKKKAPINYDESKGYNTFVVRYLLRGGQKTYRVDDIVARTFLKTEPKQYLHHIDGNKANDDYKNLKWYNYTDYLDETFGSIWQPVIELEKYFVSQDARLWSSCTETFLTQREYAGYMSVGIGWPTQFKHVHRLVAMSFCENPENKNIVNHMDGNKENNNHWNLEWVTDAENSQHAHDMIERKEKVRNAERDLPKGSRRILDTAYYVTPCGHIYSDHIGSFLSEGLNDSGYYRVNINLDGTYPKSVYVHKLVAKYFLPPPTDEQTQVNHKNKNRKDNRVSNLEWCTQKENMRHATDDNHHTNHIRRKRVAQIDMETGKVIKEFAGIKLASRETGTDHGAISNVCKGRSRSSNGFFWKYLD